MFVFVSTAASKKIYGNPAGSCCLRQFKLKVMNVTFTGYQFTYKSKNIKNTMFNIFHTKVSIFANFNIKTLFILILCFLQEENYAILDIFLFKF